MRLAHLELVTIAGLGATIVHTAFAVVTRPDGVTPGAALIGGLADVVVVAEAALVAVTVAARAITMAVRAARASAGVDRAVSTRPPQPVRPVGSLGRSGPGAYRRSIELAVFGPEGPIRGEVPGR